MEVYTSATTCLSDDTAGILRLGATPVALIVVLGIVAGVVDDIKTAACGGGSRCALRLFKEGDATGMSGTLAITPRG